MPLGVRTSGVNIGERPSAALLHFRHNEQAEAGSAQPRNIPVGHLSTMYWIGLRPGDIHAMFPLRDGPSTHGVVCLRRGTGKRRYSP